MDTTVGGISRMLGNNPTHKKVLYVAAAMLREDPCKVKDNIFALRFYMGMVASCAGFHLLSSAFDSSKSASKN